MSSPDGSGRAAYRFDLDGLRGVAIALVVGFHVWGDQVSGGVDAFLVLSGFFLARSLLRRGLPERLGSAAVDGVRQALHFIRRLLPTAALVLLGTLLLAWRVQPPSRWAETSRDVLASLFGVENWYLASTDQAYAAASGEISTTQQFWSLSVQVQVYAVAAVALLLLGFALRGARRPRLPLAAVTGATALVSFGYALYEVSVDQQTAYYATSARAWEFLIGVTIGILLPGAAKQTSALPTALRSTVGVLALGCLLGTGFLVDGTHEFPGATTLLPVAAAAALVIVGIGGSRVLSTRILRLAPLRALGKVSYPLFLWHWPLLVIALDVTGRTRAGLLLGGAVAGSAIVLAWVTHVTVELPLRGRGRLALPPLPRRSVSSGLAVTTALLPMIWLGHTAGLANQSAPADLSASPPVSSSSASWRLVPAPEVAADDGPGSTDACAATMVGTKVAICTFGDPAGGHTLVAVGGSHVRMFLPALDDIGKRHGIRVVSMIKVGCPWSLGLRSSTWDPAKKSSCLAWGGAATQQILHLDPDVVLTTGTRPRLHGQPGDHIPLHYPTRWWALDRAGIAMVLMRDTPWLPQNVPDCLSGHSTSSIADLLVTCGAPRDAVLSTDPVGSFKGRLPRSARWLDITGELCPADECLPVVGNVVAYRDSNHLTTTFVRAIEPTLSRQLGRATGWWSGP